MSSYKEQIKNCFIALAFVFLFFVIWSLFVYPVSYEDNILLKKVKFSEFLSREDFIVKDLYEKCKDNNDEDFVICLNEFITQNYIFNDNQSVYEQFLVQSPSVTLKEGGACRDYSLLYCMAAEMRGLRCDYVLSKDNRHIFSVIWFDNGYCLVDQVNMACATNFM